MIKTSNDDELGLRGFKLVRVNNGSYDPCAGIEWRPPRESDELFHALKKAFPGRKTHRDRMCEALVQFLAEELESDAAPTTNIQRSMVATGIKQHTADQSYLMSKKPIFRTQTPSEEQSASDSSSITKTKTNAMGSAKASIEEGTRKSKDWEDMTVVWKSNVGLTKGARPRRMMTEGERTDYRMRRVRGACVACKRKKRKCNHDPDPSPSTSTDTITSTKVDDTRSSNGTGKSSSPERKVRPSVRFAQGINSDHVVTTQEPGSEHSVLCEESTRNDPDNVMIPALTLPNSGFSYPTPLQAISLSTLPTTESLQRDASLYQSANMSGGDSQYCWDLSVSELQMLNKQNHTESLNIETHSLDPYSNLMPTYMWDALPTDDNLWNTSLMLDDEQALTLMPPVSLLPTEIEQKDHTQQPQIIATENRDNGYVPNLAKMENHWAQIQGSEHVEHWLEQKTIEEYSAPRDPELNLSEDEEVVESLPQKRRVKFDFSSLIDGPPTLSTPPAEAPHNGPLDTAAKQDQAMPRPPRSTSRHSTGSRMSFSDIISLSSALTSLSMKDAESRRGSVYSGSERNMEYNGEDEDSNDNNEDGEANKTNSPEDDEKSTESEDNESDDWTQWIAGDDEQPSQTLKLKDDLFEKYICLEK